MKSKEEIEELILDKFRKTNSRAGHIIMMRVFHFSLIPKLNPKEQDLFTTAINDLINNGYILYEDAIPECLRLTEKGYEYIYSEKEELKPSEKFSSHQTIFKELIMGDKIEVGNIHGNMGQIVIGKNIKISEDRTEQKQLAEKIQELILLIRQENIPEDCKQNVITNFDKVKEEISDEEEPNKPKIYRWLTAAKKNLENLVLANHTREAVTWIFEHFSF